MMPDRHDGDHRGRSPDSASDRALQRVLHEIREGLRHGYFEITVSGEVISGDRRRLLVRAGKQYQFVLPAADCESPRADTRDLREEGARETPA